MFPYIVDWTVLGHHFKMPSYGFMLALAFSAAYFDSLRRAIRVGENPKHIENLFLSIVIASILGARLFHVFFEDWSYYASHPAKIFAVWEGGYTLYGAMLLSIAAVFLYCRVKAVSFFSFVDIAAAATALGIGIGRVGCFLAGCCWGIPTQLPWGVKFSHPETFSSARGVSLHPTQLYEAFGAFGIYAYLSWRFNHRRYPGQIFFEGLLAYTILRFTVEFWRGDEIRGYVGVLSYSQLISLGLFPCCLLGRWLHSRWMTSRKPR